MKTANYYHIEKFLEAPFKNPVFDLAFLDSKESMYLLQSRK